MAKIYLDPGHGGTDPGATANGLREKDVVLDIAKRIRDILNRDYTGHTIRMSRSTDRTVSLAARTNDANNWGADYFVSIHINAFNRSANGYEDYTFNGSVQSTTRRYQDIMHEEINKQVDFTNRGKKRATFHVLREAHMSAILTENGFIDNASDAAKLKSNAYLNRIAQGHVNGLVRIFNLKRKSNSGGGGSSGLYYVQIGAYGDKSNADSQVARAKRAGFSDAYAKKEGNLYKVQLGAFSNKANADNLANRAERAGFNVYVAR